MQQQHTNQQEYNYKQPQIPAQPIQAYGSAEELQNHLSMSDNDGTFSQRIQSPPPQIQTRASNLNSYNNSQQVGVPIENRSPIQLSNRDTQHLVQVQREVQAFAHHQETKDELPCYHALKALQDQIQEQFSAFPMQSNSDFFDENWPSVIQKSAHQLEFLFMKLQIKQFNSPLDAVHAAHAAHTMDARDSNGLGPHPSNQSQPNVLDQNYNNLLGQESTHDIQMLRNSLNKADDIVKNLRVENEYFQRQLETLRQDAEVAKVREREAVQRETISRDTLAIERESFMHEKQQMQREVSQRPYSHGRSEREHQMTLSNSCEPQGYIPQPMPRPQPIMIQEFANEPPSFQKSPRKFSGGVTKARATSGGTAGVGRHSKFETRQLRQRDENHNGKDRSREPEGGQGDEIKSLKFELQQQAEMLNLKNETAKNLQAQLDQQKRRMEQDASKILEQLKVENEALRKDLDSLKDGDALNLAQIGELRKQCTELIQSKGIEMNLLVTKPGLIEAKKTSEAEGKKIVKSKSGAAGGPMGKGSKNLQFAMDINREMEMMLGESELDIKPKKNKKKKQNASKEGVQLPEGNPYENIQNLLMPEILLQNQIQAAQLADSLIDELKCTEQSHDSQVMELKTTCESMQVHSETMDEQKKFLNEKVSDLSKQNDNLKQKFSALLDQFQEYVTMQESKQVNDQEKQKQQQENLLQNMQDNIKELEHVTEGLQNELSHKESVFELLKKENKELEQKLNVKSKEDVDNQKHSMVRLEEEISFLKRHHDIEINMLKQQYERSIETAKMIGQESFQHNQMRSQLQQELNQLDNNKMTLGNERGDSIRLSQEQMPNAEPNRNGQYSLNQEYMQASHNTSTQGHYHGAHGLNGTPPSKQRVKDIISTTQHTFDKMKKDMCERDQVIEEKNREILKLRMQNEEIVQQYRRQQQPNQPHIMNSGYGALDGEQRRQLVSDMSFLVDQLRSELIRVKQGFFAQIGKQIHFEPQKQYQPANGHIMTEDGLESEILIQLAEMRSLIAIVTEIGMLSASSNPVNPPDHHGTRERSKSPHETTQGSSSTGAGAAGMSKNFHDSNYQIKRNADNLLRQNHASALHELLMEQISRSETLMQDNALMQRSLYKYETTLAELDVILRGEQRDQAIFELKKLVENQLKQIVSLQQESESGRGISPPVHPVRDQSPHGGRSIVQNSTDSRELDSLRGKLQEQRAANEELLGERRGLMELAQNLEEQVKEGHKNLEKSMDRVTVFEKEVGERVAEMEDIRQRVTKVAELFERKEIKQKYSFEVLCDFIHDKAKRLFSKYETASKERKIMQEEKNFYFQRKLDQLEQENFAMKETQRAAERIIQEQVPALGAMLDRPILQSHELSEYYYARQVLEQVEVEFRQVSKARTVLQDRNGELMRQAEALKTELRLRGPPANIGSPTQETHYSPLQKQLSAPQPGMLQPSMNIGSQSRLNPHQPHSPFEQKLLEARAQEAAEIAGRGGARTPNSSSSPLRRVHSPAQQQAFTAHDRAKSIQKDNKDSPPSNFPNSGSHSNGMGGHLASGNLRNDRNRDLSQ